MDDYFNLSTFVPGHLQNNTVPLFLLMQRLYNWTVRVSDITSTMYNQGFDVLNWKTLTELSQIYYQGQALHHDIHTSDDNTSWMKQILHIQPELTEGHASFDRQDATLTGTVNFKCPYGALAPELINLIEPFSPGDLEVTEAYISYCNIHADNEIYFDRERSPFNFRKSKVVGLARTIKHGNVFWELISLSDLDLSLAHPKQFSSKNPKNSNKYDVPIAWWIELHPASKATANAKIFKTLESNTATTADDMQKVGEILKAVMTEIDKLHDRVNGSDKYILQHVNM